MSQVCACRNSVHGHGCPADTGLKKLSDSFLLNSVSFAGHGLPQEDIDAAFAMSAKYDF